MVQIGDIHIGKAESAIPPTLNIMEAAMLWDALVARYKCIEETQIYHKYAHDASFKAILSFGVDFLKEQVEQIEKQMIKFQIPMPERPPKSINDPESGNLVLRDQFMFVQVFEGCQSFIDYFARVSRLMVTNDSLRDVFYNLLKGDLTLFDKLCKFANLKGWIASPPFYKH